MTGSDRQRKQTFVRLATLALALLCSVCRLSAQTSSPQQALPRNQAPDSIAARRLSHLRHGVNVSGWFAQVGGPKGYTKEHLISHTTSRDIALIKAMGFDHVRLSINPQPMFREGEADAIPKEYLGYLDEAVRNILDNRLAVILDIHPDREFKNRLAKDDGFVEQFEDFWRALARHYGTWDPDSVFFEILNEPEMQDRHRWAGIQAKLAAVIREGASQNTIIATGAHWSADDDLLFLELLRDANVIYSFHFYEPHIFTHQGANWGVDFWHFAHGLSYPSTPESAERAAAEVPEAAHRLYVVRYGFERWNGARIEAEISQVADWAGRHGVPVICAEFGVYREYADASSRTAWLTDVRSSLERHGIGWTVWDYSGRFGVVTKTDRAAVPDEPTVRALGLKTP